MDRLKASGNIEIGKVSIQGENSKQIVSTCEMRPKYELDQRRKKFSLLWFFCVQIRVYYKKMNIKECIQS